MSQSLRPGPWDDVVVRPDTPPVTRNDQTPLFEAVIRPNLSGVRAPLIALVTAGFIAMGLSWPLLVRGEPIMAVLFLIELLALGLATCACRRSAQDRVQQVILLSDAIEIRTTIRRRTSVERLPTAWLTLQSPPNGPGMILDTRRRRILVATWLGAEQCEDLHRTLADVLALARRDGPSASHGSTRLWCSRNTAHAPINPTLWAGGAGQS